MTAAYPLNLRTIIRSSKSRTQPASFTIAQPRRGMGYVEGSGTDRPLFWDVAFRFTQAEAATFRLWFIFTIARGKLPFTIPLRTEFGTITYELQFLPDSLMTLKENGEVFEYSAQVMARAEIIPGDLTVTLGSTIPDQTPTQGVAYSFSIAGYFTGGTAPLSFAVAGGTLPAGLSLNASTGLISGTPTLSGASLNVVFRATDSLGTSADSNAVDFTVASGNDAFYANVFLLLHGDFVTSSTNIVDSGPAVRGPISVGAATTSATQKKYGDRSIWLPASTPLTYVNSDLVNADFTHEMWVYELSTGSGGTIVSQRVGSANGWVIATSGIRALIDGSYSDTAMTWTRPSYDAWHHFAWTRSGSTLRMFIDGALVATRTGVTTIHANSDILRFGQADAGTEARFNGYLDDVRLTIGACRYTAAFTPPTEAFPNS